MSEFHLNPINVIKCYIYIYPFNIPEKLIEKSDYRERERSDEIPIVDGYNPMELH